jgi:hypothetical protein
MGHPSGRHEQLDILINALSLALEGEWTATTTFSLAYL